MAHQSISRRFTIAKVVCCVLCQLQAHRVPHTTPDGQLQLDKQKESKPPRHLFTLQQTRVCRHIRRLMTDSDFLAPRFTPPTRWCRLLRVCLSSHVHFISYQFRGVSQRWTKTHFLPSIFFFFSPPRCAREVFSTGDCFVARGKVLTIVVSHLPRAKRCAQLVIVFANSAHEQWCLLQGAGNGRGVKLGLYVGGLFRW